MEESAQIKLLDMLIERMNNIEIQNENLLKSSQKVRKQLKNSNFQSLNEICSCMVSTIEFHENGNVKKLITKPVLVKHNQHCKYNSLKNLTKRVSIESNE